jgi:5-hydroxyisourate hydrolase
VDLQVTHGAEDSVDDKSGHAQPTISTHVLDTGTGQPAPGVHVTLYRLGEDGRPVRLTQALTDSDGRVRDLLERPLVPGDYRLVFNVAGDRGAGDDDDDRFFRRLSVDVRIRDTGRSYHVPLLMAPYGLTTYRGS